MTAGTPGLRGVPSGLTSSRPLNSCTLAGRGVATVGRASAVAVPEPTWEPFGQAAGPGALPLASGAIMAETLQTAARLVWTFIPEGSVNATDFVCSFTWE